MAKSENVRVYTLDYKTEPIYNNAKGVNYKIIGWRAKQVIQLKSENIKQLGDIAAVIQKQMAISSITHKVSDIKKQIIESSLQTQAIRKFNQKAKQVATDFGFKGYKILDLRINFSDDKPEKVPMLAKTRSNTAQINIAPSSSKLKVDVSGYIELSY